MYTSKLNNNECFLSILFSKLVKSDLFTFTGGYTQVTGIPKDVTTVMPGEMETGISKDLETGMPEGMLKCYQR